MATPPGEPGRIELQIRRTPGGLGTDGWIFKSLAVGDTIRLSGPYGRFFLREARTEPAILIGGGTGLAPLKSIVRHVLEDLNPRFPLEVAAGDVVVAHLEVHVDGPHEQRMAQGNGVGGALRGLDPGNAGHGEDIPLLDFAVGDRGRRLGRHEHLAPGDGAAVGRLLRCDVDHARPPERIEVGEPLVRHIRSLGGSETPAVSTPRAGPVSRRSGSSSAPGG